MAAGPRDGDECVARHLSVIIGAPGRELGRHDHELGHYLDSEAEDMATVGLA